MRACVPLFLSVIVATLTTLAASSCERNCESDDDCDTGFTCPVVFLEECARRCTVRPLRGETCSVGSDAESCEIFMLTCDDALVCAARGNDGSSLGTCVPSEGRVLNETCNVDDECEAELVCATADATTGTFGGECAPATGRGTDVPCNDDAQCASGSCDGLGACT